jgi:hypothetical protein
MYDELRSSYDLGPQFTEVPMQTKDIEYGIGGTLTSYWISPDGYLWYPEYRETHTFEIIDEDDPRYDPKKKFLNYEYVPTGKHGKYRVHPITKYVNAYVSGWKGDYKQWPTVKLHFKYGKLQDFEDVTGKPYD